MEINNWSTSAASNTSAGGINIAEGCERGNVNDAERAIMAAIKAWYDSGGIDVKVAGAVGDGATDDYAAIAAAITAAGNNGTLRFPYGTYKLSQAISILDGQTWIMEGCTLKNTTETLHVIRANDKDDWSILGRCILQGTLTTAATAAECGLYITDGSGYHVEGVTAKKFKGKGFYLDGTTAPAYRCNRGQFVNCSANECTVGRQIDASHEYTLWSNFNAGGNITADLIAAGNTVTNGGNIVDNTTGVKLVAGTNHGHGMYIGVNINHNNSANIEAVAVINGFSFIGCHIYGNGTSTGPISLNGCKGITIQGGIIDCWIYNDSGTGSGANLVIDNYFPGDNGVTLNTNNTALGQLWVSGNYTSTGMSSLNDPAPVYVEAERATSTQDVSGAATTLIFNSEVSDKRANYDGATGIFTAPVAGVYKVIANINITAASGLTANSYVAINKNNTTDVASIPIAALSGTQGFGSGARVIRLAASDTLRLKSTITGTTPVMALTQSNLIIMQIA